MCRQATKTDLVICPLSVINIHNLLLYLTPYGLIPRDSKQFILLAENLRLFRFVDPDVICYISL